MTRLMTAFDPADLRPCIRLRESRPSIVGHTAAKEFSMIKRSSTHVLLTICAVLLAANAFVSLTGGGASPAFAQQERTQPGEVFNSGEQRRKMIEQLTQMNDRLGRLEARMEKGFNVKVLEMPPVKIEGGLPAAEAK